MNPQAYCDRIGYGGSLAPTLETLRQLHLAHLLAVPFENLDIPLGRPIVLDEAAFYRKVVGDRRGGFCYELNGLFAALLRSLGFSVTVLAAQVFKQRQPGLEFAHLLLRVDLETPWLVDVGFGDSFLAPIPLPMVQAGAIAPPDDPGQAGGNGARYRCVAIAGGWLLQEQRPDQAWENQCQISAVPRQLAEFAPLCQYQQTHPESIFTQKTICSRATPEGRITLANAWFMQTNQGLREKRAIATPNEYRALLAHHFDITLPSDAPIHRLMRLPAPP